MAERDRSAVWLDRFVRFSLPFGVLMLVWNAWVAWQILGGGGQPGISWLGVILQTVVALSLIGQSILYRRRDRGA